MAKQTLREQYKETLISNGWIQSSNQTSKKYITMEKVGMSGKLFLGKSGGMRFGRIVSKSISVVNKKRFLGV